MEGVKIYQEIGRALKKNKGKINVFRLLEKFGLEAVKKSQSRFLKAKKPRLPVYSNYIYPFLRSWLEKIIEEKTGVKIEPETPPAEIGADFAIPCFKIAGLKKISAEETAKEISDAIKKENNCFISKTETKNGYLNVFLDKNKLCARVLGEVEKLKEFYGAASEGENKIVLIDYSSPNSAKPISIGHLRSTIIGNSLKNIYEFQGWRVFGVNHLGDWGTQFGQLLFAFEKWGSEKELKKDKLGHLFDLYVRFNKEILEYPEYREWAKEIFKKMEAGEVSLIQKWAEFCALSLKEFLRIYKKFGIDFDLILGESFFNKKSLEIVEEAIAKNLAYQELGGPVISNLKESGLPTFLLKKADEASLYIGRDLAAAKFRLQIFKPDKILYIAGNEQNLHFQQFFTLLNKLSYSKNAEFLHINFGLYSLPEGRISTRAGRVVFLDDVIGEALKRAALIKNIKRNVEIIGLGAVIFNDLSQDRRQNVVFNWDKVLNLKGDSGPYLQYSYVRAKSILRKAGKEIGKPKNVLIFLETESDLVKLLGRFPEIAKEAASQSSPDKIAKYLLNLAKIFNSFYEKESVLKADLEIRKTRLLLIKAVSQTLKNGLQLLGIKTLEKM